MVYLARLGLHSLVGNDLPLHKAMECHAENQPSTKKRGRGCQMNPSRSDAVRPIVKKFVPNIQGADSPVLSTFRKGVPRNGATAHFTKMEISKKRSPN